MRWSSRPCTGDNPTSRRDGLGPAFGVALLGGRDYVQHPLAMDLDPMGPAPQPVEIRSEVGLRSATLNRCSSLTTKLRARSRRTSCLLAPGGQLTQDGQLGGGPAARR